MEEDLFVELSIVGLDGAWVDGEEDGIPFGEFGEGLGVKFIAGDIEGMDTEAEGSFLVFVVE